MKEICNTIVNDIPAFKVTSMKMINNFMMVNS